MIDLIEEINPENKKIKDKIINVYGHYYGDELSTLLGNLRDMYSRVYYLEGKLTELEYKNKILEDKNTKLEEELNQTKFELMDLKYRPNGLK